LATECVSKLTIYRPSGGGISQGPARLGGVFGTKKGGVTPSQKRVTPSCDLRRILTVKYYIEMIQGQKKKEKKMWELLKGGKRLPEQ